MRRIGWTAGAVLGALLVTGCGPDGRAAGAGAAPSAPASASVSASAPAKPAGAAASGAPAAFGREQAAADITAATTATGLPQPEKRTTSPIPVQPTTAQDKRRAEGLACTVVWETLEPVARPEEAYSATIAVLEQNGWKIDGKQLKQDALTQTKLKKRGWVLFSRRYDFSTSEGPTKGMPDMMSIIASDLSCEGRFTDTELTELLKEH